MAGAGFHSIAKLRAQMPRFATIRITAWQSGLNCTADHQPPLSGLIQPCGRFRPLAFRSKIRTSDYGNPRYGNFLCGNPPGKHRDLPTSVAEPEPQGAASFGRSRIRSRNAMRLRLRRLRLRQWY
jgi:hypothetical protein